MLATAADTPRGYASAVLRLGHDTASRRDDNPTMSDEQRGGDAANGNDKAPGAGSEP